MKHLIRNTVVSLGLALAVLSPAQAASLYFSAVPSVTVGSPFTLTLFGDYPELAGGTIDLGYNGNLLQINSVTVAPVWDFLPGRNGSQTATGVNSQWTSIGFDVFNNDPQTGSNIGIVTLNLTALAAGTSSLSILDSSETFSTIDQIIPTFGSASITAMTPTAVPLPPAVWLFASGLLGLVGIARRRSRGGK